VLNTLLQAKYNILNALPTLATVPPSQLSRETGESPEYSIVSAMLAAGHVSLSSFQDKKVVTLRGLQHEMARLNPISGMFTPSVCDQMFNNTPHIVKHITHSKATSTPTTKKMSSPSSRTSCEPTHAQAS
jgi:hypothetical protein